MKRIISIALTLMLIFQIASAHMLTLRVGVFELNSTSEDNNEVEIIPKTEIDRWDVLTKNTTVTDNKFTMPEEDTEIEGVILDYEVEPLMLAGRDVWYTQGGTDIAKSSITSIEIKNSYEPATTPVDMWDASSALDGTITAYIEDDGLGNNTYKLTIAGNGTGEIYANVNSSDAFSYFENMTSIDGLALLDVTNVTNMNNMFAQCYALEDIDVSSFETSNVTNMESMFAACQTLTSLDVSGFNTANVTDMQYMFGGCTDLTTLNISGFITSNVIDMHNMFANCKGLTSLSLAGMDTSKVERMSKLFKNCTGLTSLDLTGLNTSSVTTMADMFFNCSGLTSLVLGNLDTSNVTNMEKMFYNCKNLTSLDLSGLETNNVTTMEKMFYDCSKLESLNLAGFNTAEVTTMSNMFYNCTVLNDVDVSDFNTTKVTSMYRMFYACHGLTALDVSGFNTANVTDMQEMFCGCSGLTSLSLASFETNNVTTMYYMFYNCSGLTSLDVGPLETNNVTDMTGMFRNCSNLTSLNVSGFNSAKVTTMQDMFRGCTNLGSINLAGLETDNVTTMRSMFNSCTNLRSVDFSGKDTSKVTDMRALFYSCTNLGSVNLTGVNTSAVTTMANMFFQCTSLETVDVSNFNTANVTEMQGMFYSCRGLDTINVSSFNTAKVTDMSIMFDSCSGLTALDIDNFNTSSITESGRTLQENGSYTYYGLARFARGCGNVAEIVLGENFGQSANIPVAGDETGMFYVGSNKNTAVIGANTVMANYAWGSDNRTAQIAGPGRYTITYDANGGNSAPEAQTKYEGIDLRLTAEAPYKSGYYLSGWASSSGATTAEYAPYGTYSIDESKTLYAVWKARGSYYWSVDGTPYSSIYQAKSAAATGSGVIEMLNNDSFSNTATISGDITINGNNYTLTYTGSYSGLEILDGGNLKLNDLTLVDAQILVDAGGHLEATDCHSDYTLSVYDDVIIDDCEFAHLMIHNGASVTLSGTIGDTSTEIAIGVSASGSILNILSGTSIKGKIIGTTGFIINMGTNDSTVSTETPHIDTASISNTIINMYDGKITMSAEGAESFVNNIPNGYRLQTVNNAGSYVTTLVAE